MQQGSPTHDSNRLIVAERRAIGKVFRRQSAFFFAHGGVDEPGKRSTWTRGKKVCSTLFRWKSVLPRPKTWRGA